MFTIEMLEAYEGDSLWVELGAGDDFHRLVIDGGRKKTYRHLREKISEVETQPGEPPVDLFVMTHVDDDHIFGAVPLFADGRIGGETFGDVWYNGYTHLDPAVARKPPADLLGPKNGEIFAALLLEGGHPWNEAFDAGATVVVPDDGDLPVREVAGMKLTLLSPTWAELEALREFWDRELEDSMEPGNAEEALELFADRRSLQPDVLGGLVDVDDLLEAEYSPDVKEPNGSSIAFLAEHDGRAVLFAADAHPPTLERSIRRLLAERDASRLRLDAFKISHHGSKSNTSVELLDLVDCPRYLISTSGSRHHHPDPEAIARIVHRNRFAARPTELYFNYRSEENEIWDDVDLQIDWNYEAIYPPAGRLVVL